MKEISNLFQPQIAPWAAQQQTLFATLSRGFVAPAWNKQLLATQSIVSQSLNEQMSSIGLTAGVRKAMFPTLSPGITSRLAAGTLSSQALYAQRVRLPNSLYETVTKPLRESLASMDAFRMSSPAFEALTRRQSFTIGQALDAMREEAALAEERGERRQAEALTALTAEVVEVVEAPSPSHLERAVSDVSRQLTEIQLQLTTNEERRKSDHRESKEKRQINQREAHNLAIRLFILSTMRPTSSICSSGRSRRPLR